MTFSKPHTPNFYSVHWSKPITSTSGAPISFQRLLQLNFQNTSEAAKNKPKSVIEYTNHFNESVEGLGSTTSDTESTEPVPEDGDAKPKLTESISASVPSIHDPIHDANSSTDDLGPLLGTFYLCPAHRNLT